MRKISSVRRDALLLAVLACWHGIGHAAQLLDMRTHGHAVMHELARNNIKAPTNINELRLLSKRDTGNRSHRRYQQYFRGVPIWGHQIVKHIDLSAQVPNRFARYYNGYYIADLDKDVPHRHPTLSAQQALTLAKGAVKQNTDVTYNEKSTLNYFLDKDDKAHLAYVVTFFIDKANRAQPSKPVVIVDAQTHAVLDSWDGLAFERVGIGPGGNRKIGRTHYDGQQYEKMDVRRSGDHCVLANANVTTYHLNGGTVQPASPFKYQCFDAQGESISQNSDAINGAFSPLNDAHSFATVVYEMYHNWYGRRPLKGKLILRVHYGDKYENAFYHDGVMTFGDGGNDFFPLVSLDVVSHEIAHGVTEQSSNLIYKGQSGGINEAFSDMAGKAAEYYYRGRHTWTVGIDLTKRYTPLRDMLAPSQDGQSIDDARDYDDELNVHYSSGVFNRAFALLASEHGWTVRRAFDLFYSANLFYWTPSTGYTDGAWGVIMASHDLGYNSSSVVRAFEAVGIICAYGEHCFLLS